MLALFPIKKVSDSMAFFDRRLWCALGLALAVSWDYSLVVAMQPEAMVEEGWSDEGWLEVSAIAGQPLGIATVTFPYGYIEPGRTPRILVTEEMGRAYYPSVVSVPLDVPRRERGNSDRRIGRGALLDRLRTAIQSGRDAVQPPKALRISFAFTGETPLRLRLSGDVHREVVIPVQKENGQYLAKRAMWWQDYGMQAREQLAEGDYPPLIQTYLTSMLSSKFQLPAADLRSEKEKESEGEAFSSSIQLLAGLEETRTEILRESMRPPRPEDQERVPLPAPPIWHDHPAPPVPDQLPIEAMAKMVPPECFYLRFGKFGNYLWFRDLSASQGGDLAKMAMLRGFSYDTSKRMEKMLNTKSSVLAKLFGDSIIADMALIGRDLYVQEGPSLGVLFEAKQVDLLVAAMQQERTATAKRLAAEGVRLESIEIAGRSVSLLHAPDHSIRSFMVTSGRFVLLTTSQRIAHRFLDVAEGQPSLADSGHFRFARLLLPEHNDYTLFAYLSPEFFRGLVSPEYQIELRRRLKAISYIEMAEMAGWVAQAENVPAGDIEGLINGGYLPKWFHQRADESRTLRDGDRWVDSLRGGRGSFLPIADVELQQVTRSEAEAYAAQAAFFQQDWKQTDPLMVGIRRFAAPGNDLCERLAVEAYVAPFGREKYGWVSSYLGPPIERQIQLPADDAANVQVHLAGTEKGRKSTPDHVLFLGLKDLTPPRVGETKGLIQTLRMLSETPAYLGAWPLPGTLDRLPLGLGGGPPDALGFSKLLIGLWRWQGGGFSVLSFDRSILENCIPQLATVPAKDPAQLRGKVNDLSNTQLASWINTTWYRRGLSVSRGNAFLMDAVHQQLRVPLEDAKGVAERLLDCTLQCPLGGEFESSTFARSEMNESQGGLAADGIGKRQSPAVGYGASDGWRSTAWPEDANVKTAIPPPAYQAPWLTWFRGGEFHVTQLPDQLVLIAQLDLQKVSPNKELQVEPESPLPKLDFDLFSLPFSILGGEDQKKNGNRKEEPKKGDTRRAF